MYAIVLAFGQLPRIGSCIFHDAGIMRVIGIELGKGKPIAICVKA
jgi:hypothetical protein